ncbi:hypothetical protein [Oceanobacillus sp. CAU 1775]
MLKKTLDLQNDILLLCGIYFALRFIYIKDIYIKVGGYTINILILLLCTIVMVGVNRVLDEKIIEKIKSLDP